MPTQFHAYTDKFKGDVFFLFMAQPKGLGYASNII